MTVRIVCAANGCGPFDPQQHVAHSQWNGSGRTERVNCRNTFVLHLSCHSSSRGIPFFGVHVVSIRKFTKNETKWHRCFVPLCSLDTCGCRYHRWHERTGFQFDFRRHSEFAFRVNIKRKTFNSQKPQLFHSLSVWQHVRHATADDTE